MRRREAEARCPERGVRRRRRSRTRRGPSRVVARAVERSRRASCSSGRAGASSRRAVRRATSAATTRSRRTCATRSSKCSVRTATDVRVGIADGAFTARLAARRAASWCPRGSRPRSSRRGRWRRSATTSSRACSCGSGCARWATSPRCRPTRCSRASASTGRRFHELARGIDPGPPVLVAPPPDLVEQTELDPPAERVDVAAFAAKELADRLSARLAERGLACTRVMIEAETEHGERLARCWRHDGRAHARRARRTCALAARRLDHHRRAPPRGSRCCGSSPTRSCPADGRQLGFWGGDQVAHDRADRALARVQGMLGYDAVVTAVVQGGRTPAEQVRWVPWGEPREPTAARGGPEVAAWPGALPRAVSGARASTRRSPPSSPTRAATRSRSRDAASSTRAPA